MIKELSSTPLTPTMMEACGFVIENGKWYDRDSLFHFEEFGLRKNAFNLCLIEATIVYAIDSLEELENLYFALTRKRLSVPPSS